jgi:thymidylate synthase (FAD)
METKRPTTAAAEEILGGYFPVLDHGFVSLVDYMGSDDDVERAARVSYGYGTRKRSATRGLIRYLRRHRHTTPSEMLEFKFHCAMPMFVARQWIRHRTACLAEGTEVYFDLPGGIERQGNQLFKLRIEEIWERFQPSRNLTRPDKQRNPFFRRDRVRGMRLRQVNEETLRIQHTRVVDIYRNGRKPVFRMILEDGKSIEATADHRFLFEGGWSTLAEATGLRHVNGRAIWEAGPHSLYVNGMVAEMPALYRDRDWLDQQYNKERRPIQGIADECGVSYHTIRKWLGKLGLQAPNGGHHRFRAGQEPWTQGKTYRLGPRTLSDQWIAANHQARSGPAPCFWKGGSSSEREAIGRWTTQRATALHRRNGWTCQLCHERTSTLHCRHVVPVWADPSRARDESNLTSLCAPCHRSVSGDELAFVERLGGPPVFQEWRRRPRVPWNKLTVARLVRIERFEYVGEKETYDLEVEGPHHNFIANGVVTHNSVNEYSGRYSLMPLLYYRPDGEQFALQSQDNRQGRDRVAARDVWEAAVARWDRLRSDASGTYEWMLEQDVARELARIDLPLSTYTQWYWKIDLHNLLHFLSLRADPHAQWEIRVYARVMAGMVKRVAPLSFEAWLDYDLGGRPFSRGEREALARLVEVRDEGIGVREAGGALDAAALAETGLSPREIRELQEKLSPEPLPDFELDLSEMRTAEEVSEEMAKAVPAALRPEA